jgi:hypothetical protein
VTQPQQFTYQDALALAAGLQAATIPPEILASTIGGLTDGVATVRDTTWEWATRLILSAWDDVKPYDGDSVAAFADAAGRRMTTAQTSVARAAGASVAQGLQLMGVPTTAAASTPADVRRLDVVDGKLNERPDAIDVDYEGAVSMTEIRMNELAGTDQMFNRPARKYRYLQSQGASPEVAQHQARQLIGVQVEENLMLADRLASAEVLQQTVNLDLPGPKVTGYRRIIHPELSRTGTCGLCIAAADRIYHVADLLPIHARCKCEVAAVTSEHDPGKTLNADEIATLYRLAGGVSGPSSTAAPALKRVRFQIDEHGELGPVLVPRKAHKPRAPKRTTTR